MGTNLPFDINGFMNFIRNNHANSQPSGSIGTSQAQGFDNARRVIPKQIATKAGNPIDDALNILYGKAKQAGFGGLADEAVAGASKLSPMGMANPLIMGAMNLPIAIQNMKDVYGGEASRKNYEWAKQGLQKIQASGSGKPPVKPPALKEAKGMSPSPQAKPIVLPPMPQVAPEGSYPSYQEILKGAGVPIINNFQPNQGQPATSNNVSSAPVSPEQIVQNLAQKLGMGGYVAPEVPASTDLANQRLQQIREYLGRYSPDTYADLLKQEEGRNRKLGIVNAIFGTDVKSTKMTQREKDAEILKYLEQGYNTDMGLATTARKLSQAEAMAKATGLPSTWFEEPKDILANVVRPQITSQGQIEAYKQLGANSMGTANVNNATKLEIAQMMDATNKQKINQQMAIAKAVAEGKIAPAMIQALGGGMVDEQQLMNFLNQMDNPNLIPSQTNFGNAGDSY